MASTFHNVDPSEEPQRILKDLKALLVRTMAHYGRMDVADAGRIVELVVKQMRDDASHMSSKMEQDRDMIRCLIDILQDGMLGRWPSVQLTVPAWQPEATR